MTAKFPTITTLAADLRARRTTSQAVVDACLDRIAAGDPAINAFITVLADEARDQARQADRELAAGGDRGPLHGIPIALKDLFDLRGTPTTAASHLRRGHVADADALVVSRLRDAGAIVVGKNNLHEFAFGTTNEDSAFGVVRHPLAPNRSPGGSSGGSAAAVLAGMACASIGTDTGGSIRIPAAACGLVGLKPALEDLPTAGVVPLSDTLDHVGPICRSVADAALLYQAMRGTPATAPQARHLHGLKIGVLGGYFTALLDSEVARVFADACARLSDAGIVVENATIPHAADIAPIYLHIVLAEAAAYHATALEQRPADYTPNVRIRLEMGRYILAEDYVRAMRGRSVLSRDVEAALSRHDALLLPSLAVPATRLGDATVRIGSSEEAVRNITLRLTQLFNLTGHPAITLPCGQTKEGLPVGAQLVGPRHSTAELLQIAATVESVVSS
jgi:aspartyl-tRNA(Asn)/glutamyl-tRNA(Gln) amidotransferase subunit A